jgi:VanZ family protein
MWRAERSLGHSITRPIPALAALIWMGVIFALSSRSTIPVPFGLTTELTSIAGHFVMYAVLAVLLWWAIEPLDLSAPGRFALALAGAVAYGLTDEWHQSFVPGRDASLIDILVDSIGALCGLAVVRRVTRSLSARDDTP